MPSPLQDDGADPPAHNDEGKSREDEWAESGIERRDLRLVLFDLSLVVVVNRIPHLHLGVSNCLLIADLGPGGAGGLALDGLGRRVLDLVRHGCLG